MNSWSFWKTVRTMSLYLLYTFNMFSTNCCGTCKITEGCKRSSRNQGAYLRFLRSDSARPRCRYASRDSQTLSPKRSIPSATASPICTCSPGLENTNVNITVRESKNTLSYPLSALAPPSVSPPNATSRYDQLPSLVGTLSSRSRRNSRGGTFGRVILHLESASAPNKESRLASRSSSDSESAYLPHVLGRITDLQQALGFHLVMRRRVLEEFRFKQLLIQLKL